MKQIMFLVSADKIKKIILEIIISFSTFHKITVGGFVNQIIKKSGLKMKPVKKCTAFMF